MNYHIGRSKGEFHRRRLESTRARLRFYGPSRASNSKGAHPPPETSPLFTPSVQFPWKELYVGSSMRKTNR
eukprot:1619334-Pyramimonas_sp.AAC.1